VLRSSQLLRTLRAAAGIRCGPLTRLRVWCASYSVATARSVELFTAPLLYYRYVFILEAVLKLLAQREKYFFSNLNRLDFTIVVVSVVRFSFR
jgi:hypothetical protein